MRIFKHPLGYMVAIGFDPSTGRECRGRVCITSGPDGAWRLDEGGDWNDLPDEFDPDFVLIFATGFYMLSGSAGYLVTHNPGAAWRWRFEPLRTDVPHVVPGAA